MKSNSLMLLKNTKNLKKKNLKNLKLQKRKKRKNQKLENEFASKPDNAISLNAQTTLNLFEDLGYNLKDIRAGQKVKPIYLTKLPKDLKTLGDTRERRDLFIKIVLPLILNENEKNY